MRQASLVAHTTPYDPTFNEHLATLTQTLTPTVGSHAASEHALALIYNLVQAQARLWGFVYDFRLFGYLCIAVLPMILLLRRVKAGKSPVAAE